MLQTGRKKIAHITGPLDYQVSLDRLEGYKKALEDHKVLYDPALVVSGDFNMESGIAAVEQLLRHNIAFDGLFSGNDRMAIGAMRGLKAANKAIPDQIAVVGCDNMEMASMIEPTLTTIHQSLREIGQTAATKMIALLLDQEIGAKQTVIPAQLIKRESA